MSKQLPYFKFYSQDWLAGKIDRQPLEVQGAFIQLVSVYWGKEGDMNKSDIDYRIGEDNLKLLIKLGFLRLDDGIYSVPFLDEQLSNFQDIRDKRRKAGEASAAARANTCSTHVDNIEERREEKSREEKKQFYNDWIDLFNSVTGKKMRVVGQKTKKQIMSRLKEGHTMDDIKSALEAAVKDPYHIEHGLKYISLEFITRSDKLERYVSQQTAQQPMSRDDRQLEHFKRQTT